MIIDGKALAREVLARAKARAALLSHPPKVVALMGVDTPATRSYLAIKKMRALDAGCTFETRPLGADYTDVDAVIIQLPLPAGVDKEVLDTIPLEKDADVLSAVARTRGELLPPVVGAVAEICKTYSVNPSGKRAVVVGKGFLVGAPAAGWLKRMGAEVTVADSKTDNIADLLRGADIIVSGVGIPHIIKLEMLKEGTVLIDAGTSESNGVIVGDADPACAAKCSLFTPVPGGVGPLAVAKLFENAVELARRADSAILSS